jgi:hypothetical protein
MNALAQPQQKGRLSPPSFQLVLLPFLAFLLGRFLCFALLSHLLPPSE